jgi:hypothetical protein
MVAYYLLSQGGGSSHADSDLVGSASSSIDPGLGPLQDNDGPTLLIQTNLDSCTWTRPAFSPSDRSLVSNPWRPPRQAGRLVA